MRGQLDPQGGETRSVTPLVRGGWEEVEGEEIQRGGRGGYEAVEVGVILTDTDSSDSFSSKPVGKGESEQ